MSEAKPTPGPLRVQADDKWPFYIRTFDAAGDCAFREDMPAYSTAQRSLAQCLLGLHMSRDSDVAVRANAVALANAELRAEAHNVLTATGLTPSQLVEQRDGLVERVKELEEALSKLAKSYERVMQLGAPPPDALKAARAAISKARPNTAEGEGHADSVLDDAARLDWIAMHGTFGVDSVSGDVGGNGQKRMAATRKNIDAARKQGASTAAKEPSP